MGCTRRYATLIAQAVEGRATVTDEIIDLHDRIVGKMLNTARNKHGKAFRASGRAINDRSASTVGSVPRW